MPARALVGMLSYYLTPAKRPFTKWWLNSPDGPESRHVDRSPAVA